MAEPSKKEVEEIALLARLALTDDEVGSLARDLGQILSYIQKLQALDTNGVEPMTHAVPMNCPLREDEQDESLPVDEAMANAPQRAEDFFEVPIIIGGDSG